MVFRVRTSSADRHWNGFDAFLYEASAGFSEQQFVRHNVSMQVGRPLLVTSRCNGETLRRLQVPGDVKIVPPGRAARLGNRIGHRQALDVFEPGADVLGRRRDGRRSRARRRSLRSSTCAIRASSTSAGPSRPSSKTPEPLGRLYGDSLGARASVTSVASVRSRMHSLATASFRVAASRASSTYVQDNIASDLSLAELAQDRRRQPVAFQDAFQTEPSACPSINT